MTKLKQCPLCGEESNIYLGDSTDGYIRGTQYIEAYCNKCGARIKRHLESEAVEAWNTRPNPWHTGEPTEEGWYFCLVDTGTETKFMANEWKDIIGYQWVYAFLGEVIAWRKAEDPLKILNEAKLDFDRR